jgi:ketosteroid isomerase-like protein
MRKIVLATLIAVLGSGCGGGCSKKKRPEEGLEPPPAQPAPGSAAGSAAEVTKPLTGAELAKRWDDCLALWNANKFDDEKSCFTKEAVFDAPGLARPQRKGAEAIVDDHALFKTPFPDAKGESGLILVGGERLAVVMLMSGTHTAPLETPWGPIAPTNKKMGVVLAEQIEFDDTGHARQQSEYYDLVTVAGQVSPQKDHPARPVLDKLPMPKEVVVSLADAKETANIETVKHMFDTYNKHDAKGFADQLSDDTVWSDQTKPKDFNKKENLADLASIWKGFSDAKIEVTSVWAAGDYVVATGNATGTNDGTFQGAKPTGKKVSVPFLSIHKVEAGKVKQTWVFRQQFAATSQLGLITQTASK